MTDKVTVHRGYAFEHWEEATDEHRQHINEYLDLIEELDPSDYAEVLACMKEGHFWVGDDWHVAPFSGLNPHPDLVRQYQTLIDIYDGKVELPESLWGIFGDSSKPPSKFTLKSIYRFPPDNPVTCVEGWELIT